MFRYIAVLLLLPTLLLAEDYKEFTFSRKQQKYVELYYNRGTDQLTLTGYTETDTLVINGNRKIFKKENQIISLNNLEVVTATGFKFNNTELPFENISDTRMNYGEDYIRDLR